jgi:hypothetical protein
MQGLQGSLRAFVPKAHDVGLFEPQDFNCSHGVVYGMNEDFVTENYYKQGPL